VLEQVAYRVAWLEHQEAARRKQEEALEKERVSYAQVDWHNFVVVETVDYQQWEVGNFPPPTNPVEVGARVLIQRRQEEQGSQPQPVPHGQDSDSEDEGAGVGADTNVQDMEEGSSEEDEPEQPRTIKAPIMAAPPVAAPVPPITPRPDNVTIKKYDPKAAAAMKKRVEDDQFLISPITGEKIPASQAAEHMKVGLLDPRWVEERDKHTAAKQNEQVIFAPGQSIESNLKNLAERRTDIFGVGDEAAQEAGIGMKMVEEEREKAAAGGGKVPPQGQVRSGGNRQNIISVDDQIAQIHKQQGFVPERTPEPERPKPPPVMPPQQMPAMPPKVRRSGLSWSLRTFNEQMIDQPPPAGAAPGDGGPATAGGQHTRAPGPADGRAAQPCVRAYPPAEVRSGSFDDQDQ
jgi:splicing factor 3A subunit 1